MATDLTLIRHGNAVRVNGDYVHAPLTLLGQEQAAQTGQYFNHSQNHLDGFYTSPLLRTLETASIIGAKIGQNAEVRPGLQELRLYEVPGLVIMEILSITNLVNDYLERHIGGPIWWPIIGRVSSVLLEIIDRHPNQRVAVVAHSGVISAALTWYFPEKRWRWWRTTVSNCSLTRFKIKGNRAELLAFNDKEHLNPLLITTQPPTKSVEIAEEAHPIEKAMVFDKTTNKEK